MIRIRSATSLLLVIFCTAPLARTQGVPLCEGSLICPCSNTSALGAGEGCRNATGSGALLTASGNAWTANDSLVLTVTQATPNEFGIFIQNTTLGAGQLTYNGLLCLPIDAHLVRHYGPPAVMPTVTDAGGMGVNMQLMTVGDFLGDTQPGVTVYYQFWFRDTPGFGISCNDGANFSSGLAVTWELGSSDNMVLVPGGTFEMGDHHGDGSPDELPVHVVDIDAFDIDVYEVTNEQYCAYLNSAHGQGLIEVTGGVVYKAGDSEPYCNTYSFSAGSRIHWNGASFSITAGKDDHPMVMVSWYGAVAYCNWRSVLDGRPVCYDLNSWACSFGVTGYRLPTEGEWEKAARGGEHSPYYRYPWGDGINGSNANYGSSGDPYETGPYPWTTPVGYYDGGQTPLGGDMANGHGLYDMAGSVWEWCNDWWDYGYYASSPYANPTGPSSGSYRVIRGGSWSNPPSLLRVARRDGDYPEGRNSNLGFRVLATRP